MSSRNPSSPCIRASLCLFLGAASLGAQSLTVTDGLQLWLKADAGVTSDAGSVSAWGDQSPNAHSAVALDPSNSPLVVDNVLNGKPVLRFDGIDDYLSIDDSEDLSFAGDMTTFFVVKFDDFDTFRAVWAKTANNLPAPTDFYTLPGSGIPQVYRGDGGTVNIGSFASSVALRAGTFLTVGFGIEGTTCSHFLGGQTTSSGQLPVAAGDGDTALLIGTRGDLFTKMKGDIAEILIYDRALSAEERTAVTGYLGTKYNIANLPPSVTLAVTPPGPTLAPGDVVTLTATPLDPDGTITSVKFLANGSLLGVATAAPYTLRVALNTPATYQLSAQAVDDKSATGDSTPSTRTVSGGAAPDLTAKSSLQLWLKADAGVTTGDGGIVSTWADQSGKGNNAVPTDATTAPIAVADDVNSHPAIRFDGDNDQLEVADSPSISITGDITSFFVVRMDDFATFRSVWAKTAGNLPAPTDFYTVPGSGIPRVYRGDGTGNNLASVDGKSPLHAGAFDLVGFSSAGAAFTHYLNGAANGTGTTTTSTADLDNTLYIGTRGDFVTRLKGDLAELLIFDSALAGADLANVQAYLAWKYALPSTTALNDAPATQLTGPADSTTVLAPADVTLTADASDTDGSVVKVEFLANGAVIATSTSAPYSATVKFTTASVVSLQSRATDNLGGVTVSAPRTLTVTATEPNPLPSPANLSLWLRADKGVTTGAGGVVTGWEDQSGNFNHAAQTTGSRQPLLVDAAVNSKAVIRFDGNDDSMVVGHSPTLAITGDITTFFVVKFDDFDTFRAVWAKTQGNQPASSDFYTQPNSGIPRVFRGNGGSSAGFVDGANAPVAGDYTIVGWDMAGTTLHHYLNGAPNGEGALTATLGDTGAPLLIGTRGDQFTRMKGDIAEIIIYNKALSGADRAAAFHYLGKKYAIAIPPTLSSTLGADGKVTISYPADYVGFQLETTTAIDGTWDPVPGVVNNTYTLDPSDVVRLFRLTKP